MTFALTLHLDPATDEAIRGVWQQLADAGLSRAVRETDIPHLTLWVSDELEGKTAPRQIDSFVDARIPFEIRLRSVGVFPARWGPVFFAPVPTEELLTLHRDAIVLAMDVGAYPQWHRRPAHWVPHITASLELTEGEVAAATQIVTEAELPEATKCTGMTLFRVLPETELIHRASFPRRPNPRHDAMDR